VNRTRWVEGAHAERRNCTPARAGYGGCLDACANPTLRPRKRSEHCVTRIALKFCAALPSGNKKLRERAKGTLTKSRQAAHTPPI